jgi:hypothetical protein
MTGKTKSYTVVGLYHDNKQVWVGHVKAKTVAGAVQRAHMRMRNCSGQGGGAVLSVFNGELTDLYGEDELLEN